MKSSKVLKVILFISGLIAIGVGGSILFMPSTFYAASGINLNGEVNLLNEIRASGGMIFAFGILIMTGAFVARLTYTATVISMLLYLTYALSRIFSMSIDGIPVDTLVQALVLEIVIGILSIFAYLKYRVKADSVY